MAENSVGYSRAGDAFHYRWAARRSLKLIYPNSSLSKIIVEGSNDAGKKEGELVIDLTEYYGEQVYSKIIYYQLKHTTVQKDKPFMLSDLKETFEGFAKKFLELKKENYFDSTDIRFSIITNRPFDENFKKNLKDLSNGKCEHKRFINTFVRYTKLSEAERKVFCSILTIEDSHQDYQLQKMKLRMEMRQLLAGEVDINELNSLYATIADKVLPDSDGTITREHVLRCFGIDSVSELYPAEPIWEPSGPVVERYQYREITDHLLQSTTSVIVHASGGVGKSVFTRYLLDNISEGSVAIGYDCFGAGKYRNRSHSRHRHRDALVQIANELSAKALCEPILFRTGDDEASLMRSFLKRLSSAVEKIQLSYPQAVLLIIIDAADNAEMAAKQFADNCFAAELLKEEIPEGCRLVYLCRPERIDLLQVSGGILELELHPFSVDETKHNLKIHFNEVTNAEAEEFHRLTSGNPRVQANALDVKPASIEELLKSFGPYVQTVEVQIEKQLENAIVRLRDRLTVNFQEPIDRICRGLAILSPHIPLDILADAAGVKVSEVKSFVAEIGRSLWLSENSVQFRDEPTETWFRERYKGSQKDLEGYIAVLEPLAQQSAYAAQVLPQLYHEAEKYDKLIEIALSDRYLPESNPVEARNIRVYRLQFAIKAALRKKQVKDACVLALRAGEEVAGNERQVALLKKNIDLLVSLQDRDRVYSMAMRRELAGSWEGSENVYAASILSCIPDYHGEARGFLRSAENWLNIYFSEQEKSTEQKSLTERDLLEIAFAKLNLYGADCSAQFMLSLKPRERIAKIFTNLIRRLIDVEDFGNIDRFLEVCKDVPSFIIRANLQLFEVGKHCKKSIIEPLLKQVTEQKIKFKTPKAALGEKPNEFVIALVETALHYGVYDSFFKEVLNANRGFESDNMFSFAYHKQDRDCFLRWAAATVYLDNTDDSDVDKYLDIPKKEKKLSYEDQRRNNDKRQVFSILLPWYIIRIELIANGGVIDPPRFEKLVSRSEKANAGYYDVNDTVSESLAKVFFDILKFADKCTTVFLSSFYDNYILTNNKISVDQLIDAVRICFRLPHLHFICDDIEKKAYNKTKTRHQDGPEVLSNYYISLARAVINRGADNAAVYFEDAFEIVSKYGDEMLRRWDAIVPLAEQTAKLQENIPELSFKFLRVAELVGRDHRDKHWDREGALQIATRISPADGIATLSRWRDREFGTFELMIYCLLIELVNSEIINPMDAWCFTEFCSSTELRSALRLFLKSSKISDSDKRMIAEDGIQRLRTEINSNDYFIEIFEILEQQNIASPLLNNIKSAFSGITTEQNRTSTSYGALFMPDLDWDKIFSGKNLLSEEGITAAYEALHEIASENGLRLGRHEFFVAALDRLADAELIPFLEKLLICSWLEEFDVVVFFENLPQSRTLRLAFQKRLQSIVGSIGKRFVLDLTNRYTFDSMIKVLPGPAEKSDWLLNGMFTGLISTQEFATAENLFGLVQQAAPLLTPEEASQTLDYGLARFEQHLEDDFGDGPWNPWFEVKQDVGLAMVNLLLSALSSPVSATRWKAVHVMKKFAQKQRLDSIRQIFVAVEEGNIGAFGAKKFPYYNLHALQYLLIASSRIVQEYPGQLKAHANFFLKYALDFEHVIIQHFAAGIMKRLELDFPNTFAKDDMVMINLVNKPTQMDSDDSDEISETDENDEENDDDPEFMFGYDFSRYWLGELGEVFGVLPAGIVNLAKRVIVDEWGREEDAFDDDPRHELWDSGDGYYRISHDHGRYPRDDNFSFYLSYHSMMTVAARLIKIYPLVTSEYFDENLWGIWLDSHLLTRKDNYWVSDWKDPVPLERPKFEEIDFKVWQSNIKDNDFLNCVTQKINGATYLNVIGTWSEILDHKKESYEIASALVSPQSADALMRALENCENMQSYKLPFYEERNMEISTSLFELLGWIEEDDLSRRLDENDPFGRELPIPPYTIGKSIVSRFGLTRSVDHKSFFSDDKGKYLLARTEMWASEADYPREQPSQNGLRMYCNLDFLKDICKNMEKEIVFEVQIRRNYYSNGTEGPDKSYRSAVHKIFILSADGTLRSTERNYRIG